MRRGYGEYEAFYNFGWCAEECNGPVGGCIGGGFVRFQKSYDFAGFPD